MFCANDGIENREGATRCKKCGACLNCGEIDPGPKICRKCRIPLERGNLCPRGHFTNAYWGECDICARTRMLPLGLAPDGLPFRLSVDTGPSASELLEPLARRLDLGAGEHHNGPLKDIRKRVDDLLYRQNVQPIQTGERQVECFISSQPARLIFGATLLERMLGERSSRRRKDTRISASARRQPTENAASRTTPRPVGVGHLAVPLQGGDPIIVTRTGSGLAYSHSYEPETIQSLASARFEIHVPSHDEHYAGPMTSLAPYRDARSRIFATGATASVQCEVERNEVAQLIANLALQVQDLHQRGEVHGDVKPANALITRSGVLLIDSLQLKPAQYSPAMTPGWAAPEQVIGEPVSFATDQYPLGVMLCRILGAVVYGEEVTYLIPGGGETLERFTLLRNPGAYLDASSGTVPEAGVRAWQGLVNRCLQFRPDYRFGTVRELAEMIESIAADYPLGGTSSIDLTFGELTQTPELGWQLYDIRGQVPRRNPRART